MFHWKGRDRISARMSARLDGKTIVKMVRLDKNGAAYLAKIAKEKNVSEAQFFRDLLDEYQRTAAKLQKGASVA